MKADLSLFAKGVAMGAANVIPGVSGGTIALITGIYERLINALKSGDITSLKLLLSGKFSDFWQRIDGRWLSILCLLYTSPSPRDRTRSRMPSSA